MKRITSHILFLFLACFSGEVSPAQTASKVMDSLLTALRIPKPDTARIDNLNALSEHCYRRALYAEAGKYAKEALELASLLEKKDPASPGIKNRKAAALSNTGTTLRYQGKFSEALPLHQEALKIYEATGNKRRIALACIAVGNDYMSVGNYTEAMNLFRHCLETSEEISYPLGICLANGGFGLITQFQGKYAESLNYTMIALKIRIEMGDKFGIANTYNNIAGIHFGLGKPTEALNYYERALKIREEIDDRRGIASCYNSIGDVYLSLGNYTEALRHLLASLKIRREIDDDIGAAFTTTSIGMVYQSLGNYAAALSNHQAALKARLASGDKRGIAQSHNHIGLAYQALENYPEALHYFSSALKLGEELGDKRITSTSNSYIGDIYKLQGNYAQAYKNLSSSLQLFTELGNKSGVADCCIKLGELLLAQSGSGNTAGAAQKYDDALPYLEKAISIAKETGEKDKEKTAWQVAGKIYAAKKNYAKALDYQNQYIALKDSLMNSETSRKLEQQRTQYEVEKAVAEEKFQSDRKLEEENTRHQLALAEEELKKEKAIEIEKLKYQFALATAKTEEEKLLAAREFENEKKLAAENARHLQSLAEEKARQSIKDAAAKTLLEKEKAEKKRKSEMYITLLLALGLVSVFAFILFRQRNLKRRAVEKAEAGHKMAELELQSLRAQLNPHFMFNSLNAIQELILLEDNERSHIYLSRFSKLIRTLLENANQPFIPLKKEIDFLELYLSLEKLRVPDLEYSITTDPGIDTKTATVPNMMLQPFIENAIWHGLSPKTDEKKLWVRIYRDSGFVEYTIEDNGIGRRKAEEMKSLYRKEHKSKGMELLTKRFKLLNEKFGSEITTHILDVIKNRQVCGTKVTIRVPGLLTVPVNEMAG